MTKTWDVVAIAAAAGCGVLGGVFFAFSAFIMSGLSRLPGPAGREAMKSINVTAVRAPLMLALFGTGALCVALVVRSISNWDGRGSALLLVGAVLYLLGAVVLTAVYNVPLNDRLAKVNGSSAHSIAEWQSYLHSWTIANHVRAATSIAAMVAITLALVSRSPSSAASLLEHRSATHSHAPINLR